MLAAKCYACHSSKLKAPMGSLILDTKAGVLQGGASGPAVVPGKPDQSLLVKALTYSDPHVQMPPSGKLADDVIEDFRQWIASGAPDTRVQTVAATTPLKGMSVEEGRKWWAFQPLKTAPPLRFAMQCGQNRHR
ncbi:MAG: c-type cytochrome domain-containing protein [Bryobacteraceae bacterium]